MVAPYMQNERCTFIQDDTKLDGKRKVGRPRLRWMDDVQADLWKTGITNWRKKAIDQRE